MPLDFSALLFVPGMKPFQAMEDSRKSSVRLHVRRMFITDEAELLPPWLRFVHGVVDTEDLPLNVSREMIQESAILTAINRARFVARAMPGSGFCCIHRNNASALKAASSSPAITRCCMSWDSVTSSCT